ncbi:hypothetical protein B9Z45_16025 [Limnohabitans sp. 2KL-17]|uniref:beta family protein n=1 Tax=Limnohabitans sp. 2KL-17 TaxID=1100704 RepID=UPI000D33D17D|nr:beta family protein [Limnohabitans sp. 2KL-17]PUE48529.1 hypothetical protein B9Z45_16025 [Limnohabitans sp. 2KL-17]
MTDPIYTPMLKSKQGEAKALMRLDRQTKSNIIPFFDVLALKSGLSNGSDIHAFLEKQAINIAAAWNGRGHCYVDLYDVDPSARGYDGAHPVNIVHDKIAFDRIDAIPVVGVERDIAYKLAVRRVVGAGVDAVAIRLGSEDIQLPSMLVERVSRLVSEIGASDLPLHVFMDFRSIEHTDSDIVQMRFTRALAEVRKLNPSRIIFAASAFVSDMGKVKKGALKSVARRDFLVWEMLAKIHPDIDYADYGVIHPGYFDFDPKTIKPAAKIRYTADKEWLIVKGSRWVSDTSQHRNLSKLLCKSEQFRGGDCWGSENIVSAAQGGHAFKRLEDWVTIDQNNHITHTVRQLSRIPVSPKAAV